MKKESPYKSLGMLIANLRLKAGMAQQSELAKMIKSTQQTVSRWERGLSRPRQKQIPLLAKILNVEVDDLSTAAKYMEKTTVATFDQPFPVDALNPDSFQRFSLYFLQALYPDAEVHPYGGPGHTQEGLDVEATFPDKTYYTFQCKRVAEFGKAKIEAAVKAHTRKAKKKFFLLSRIASPDARKAIKKYASWELWDKEDISRFIRQNLPKEEQLKLVDTFFRGQRLALLGEMEAGAWQTAEEFFAPYMPKRGAFNHAWHLVGRSEELKEIIDGLTDTAIQLVLLIGTGGAGKSRILKQAIEQFRTTHKGTSVYFLSPSAEVTAKDLENLGNGRKVLVVDDAHDRTDLSLSALLQYAAATENKTTLLFSLRPYGMDFIRTPISNFAFTKDCTSEIRLNPLTVEQATELAGEVLKEYGGSESAAKDIAALTFDCPLATVIGAQIVAKEKIHIEDVKNKDEFRSLLLAKFQDIIAGSIGHSADAEPIRKLLKVIALVQPFHPEDQSIAKILEKQEGIRTPDTNRLIRLLNDAGVLFKRGGQYRISPDLLADYIIEANCIGIGGRSTGYAEQVFDITDSSSHIENILVNLGKLDWRLAGGNPANSHLLDDIWKKLKPSWEYGDPHLKAIAAVAYYQPSRTLGFVEQLMREEKHLKDLPEIIKYCAYNLDYLSRACACLWELGKRDNRELNPNPEHPIRVLAELGEIQRNKPVLYNDVVLDFALSLIEKEDSWQYRYTPFDLMKGMLQTEGHTTNSTGRAVTFTPFLVSYKAVEALRSKTLNATIKLLSHSNIKIGVLAARFLHEGLTYPRGIFNNVISEEARESWTDSFIETLEKIEAEVKAKKLDNLVLFGIERSVSWHAYRTEGKTVDVAQRIISLIPYSLEYRTFYTLIDGYGHFQRSRDFKESQKEWEKHLRTLAADLVGKYPEASDLHTFIEYCLTHIANNYKDGNTCPYVLYRALVETSLSFAKISVEAALKKPDLKTAAYAHLGLAKILREDHTEGLNIAHQFLKSKATNLHAAVGGAYHGTILSDGYGEEDFEILRKLLTSSDQWVVHSAILPLWNVVKHDQTVVINLLKCVDLGTSERVADEVFSALHHVPIQMLKKQDIDHFLSKLLPLEELEGHWIETFLADVSEYHAQRAAKFFMDRVEYAVKADNWRYRPCNFGPYSHVPLRFRQSPEFISVLRQVSAWMKAYQGDSLVFSQRVGELFDTMFNPFDNEMVGFLQTWIDTAQEQDIRLICNIIGEASNDFIYVNQPFVMRFLEKAKQLGKDSLERANNALFRSAIEGVRSGAPGEPFPEDIRMKEEAEKMLKQIDRFSPAYSFYDSLKNHAERGIRRSQLDKESFEAEIM